MRSLSRSILRESSGREQALLLASTDRGWCRPGSPAAWLHPSSDRACLSSCHRKGAPGLRADFAGGAGYPPRLLYTQSNQQMASGLERTLLERRGPHPASGGGKPVLTTAPLSITHLNASAGRDGDRGVDHARNIWRGVAWLIPYCARPASTF